MSSEDDLMQALRSAIERRDPAGVEDALAEAFAGGLTPGMAPLLIDLLEMDWHFRHEDVARALQKLRPPEAVEALYGAALSDHAYRRYDEFFGLARRCTWALADIGTETAREALLRLAGADNSKIADYAQKRLDSWDSERHRKRS